MIRSNRSSTCFFISFMLGKLSGEKPLGVNGAALGVRGVRKVGGSEDMDGWMSLNGPFLGVNAFLGVGAFRGVNACVTISEAFRGGSIGVVACLSLNGVFRGVGAFRGEST